jgi:2-deoxy-D-gluconate 3-dehydrogenase
MALSSHNISTFDKKQVQSQNHNRRKIIIMTNKWKPLAEMLRLDGKVAIVTGGARGIGHGIVLRLAEAGASVLIADIEMNHALKDELFDIPHKVGSGKVDLFEVDMANGNCGIDIIEAAIRSFGRVDILVNNAGIYPIQNALDMPAEVWDKIHSVNLRGPFLVSQEFARYIRDHQHNGSKGGGVIVNIGSIDSLHPSSPGLAAYDASKGGLFMLTRNFALEVAPLNIRVNLVAPGAITTEGTSTAATAAIIEEFKKKIPLARMGVPDDIATVVLTLCTPLTKYMTGSHIVCDGGVLLK